MQLAFFHEYGHLVDLYHKHDKAYARKRQKLYEQLQASETLQRISSNTELPQGHRDYLLSLNYPHLAVLMNSLEVGDSYEQCLLVPTCSKQRLHFY